MWKQEIFSTKTYQEEQVHNPITAHLTLSLALSSLTSFHCCYKKRGKDIFSLAWEKTCNNVTLIKTIYIHIPIHHQIWGGGEHYQDLIQALPQKICFLLLCTPFHGHIIFNSVGLRKMWSRNSFSLHKKKKKLTCRAGKVIKTGTKTICVPEHKRERVTNVPFPFHLSLGAEVYQWLDDQKTLASFLWNNKLLQCCQLEVYNLQKILHIILWSP